MSETSFSYVIDIHATADEVWRGLVDPEITRRYWSHENISDWKPGSGWLHRRTDSECTADIVGTVYESDPPHRLVLSWALPDDIERPAKISRVAFEISPRDGCPYGPWVGVRVVHSELEAGSEMLRSISFGWPAVPSDLKVIIESPDVFGSS
jgi:uncharacterized protein YndB with AHSA1/START domain